ncbi:hypothetical protein [Bradyrhizobium sp. 33ap4]|nr:hypothetical protein [Bradyrhizobium sp. 33ap4]
MSESKWMFSGVINYDPLNDPHSAVIAILAGFDKATGASWSGAP